MEGLHPTVLSAAARTDVRVSAEGDTSVPAAQESHSLVILAPGTGAVSQAAQEARVLVHLRVEVVKGSRLGAVAAGAAHEGVGHGLQVATLE